jgi:DNA-binding LytR/AlgR family response regulator
MHILIADDETPARSELKYILEVLAPEASFFEAKNGAETLKIIESKPIEVVFLDINMPGLDGLEVAAIVMEMPEPPLIVFATAYHEHALQAFELAALDYVVKPFDERRLAQTVERIRQARDERALLEQKQASLRKYLMGALPSGGLTKLWGQRDNDNRVLVDYEDILWIMAEAKKVYLYTIAGEKLLVNHTLKELEKRLSPHNFVQVHKAYLVNLNHIVEVIPWFSGTYLIHIDDAEQSQIPMSRGYATKVKKLTGW